MDTPRRISIRVGPPVEGDDFYGRESDLRYVWDTHISKGVSLLLAAPRRVGKSSFAKMVLKIAEKHGWKNLYIDLEGLGTEDEFVKCFKREWAEERWWDRVKSQAGNTAVRIFESIEDFEVAGSKISISPQAWRNDTYDKIRQLLVSKDIGDVLVVLDELTVFLDHLLQKEDGREKVEFFLAWLRSFRQLHGKKVRWIICSSVGLENFAAIHRLSKHIDDLKPYPLEAFSEDEALELISRLGVDERVVFTEDHRRYIVKKLDWCLPYFIQLLVEEVNRMVCVHNRSLSDDLIDEAYGNLIAGSHFNTWVQRLDKYGPLEEGAHKILRSCAVPAGATREVLLTVLSGKRGNAGKMEIELAQLLDMLRTDGYLIVRDGRYGFRSPLLRDFWYNRFIK